MTDLRVKTDKLPLYTALAAGLIVVVPLAIGNIYSGLTSGFSPARTGIGVFLLVGFTVVIMVMLRGRSKSVKLLSMHGLVRNDGMEFRWSDLTRVVNRITPISASSRGIWRTEIHFHEGANAWIIPSKVLNYVEVKAYINALPCEHIDQDA